MTPNERCALAIALAKVDPTMWHVQIDPDTKQASITWLGR